MQTLRLAAVTIGLLTLLLILHVYGMSGHWYLYFPYFDLITHFLGGVGIALSALYVMKNPKHIILISIIAGIVWEIFEVYYDITGWPISSINYQIDTAIDIVMDTLGAVAVWLIVRKNK